MLLDQQTIDEAARRLLAAAPAGSDVILFGSYATGRAGRDSDLDFLVIEPVVADRHAEMARLRKMLDGLADGVGVDVLVTSRADFEYWRDTPDTVYFDAAREGRVYGQVA